MKEKYNISGTLGVSDQYDLDGYQVWGTYWSTPYIPSKIHAGIPSQDSKGAIDLVTFRWAHRDPLNGYLSPTSFEASIYSTQDYQRLGEDITYFEKLLNLYSKKSSLNDFGQITVGLEGDFLPDTYSEIYSDQLDSVLKLQNEGVAITSMKEFSKWYLDRYQVSPPHTIASDDVLGSEREVFWYQSPNYRVGVIYNKEGHDAEIVDLRDYFSNFAEPFFKSPNKQYSLYINLPYLIDSVIDKSSRALIDTGELISVEKLDDEIVLSFERGKLSFSQKGMRADGFTLPENVSSAGRINYQYDVKGIEFRSFALNVPFTIERRIEAFKIPIALVFVFLGIVSIKFLGRSRSLSKYFLIVSVLVFGLYLFSSTKPYYVGQAEADALTVLSRLPKGRVLVYDKDCLRCNFETLKPAAAAGLKSYVAQYGKKEIITDFSFVTSENSKKARQVLVDLGVDYIYLAKYEDYIEYIPYPEDLGLEPLYRNANAEIWRVSK